jgi:HAE1 family hydrophobic/amphiphilic exporter-1
MRAVAAEIRAAPGVRLVLASAGGGFLGRVNQGYAYVRLAPHEGRVFSLPRLGRALLRGDPGEAFRGNYTQRSVMQEVRRRLRAIRDVRPTVRNLPSFNIGGGNFDIDFVLRGPDLVELARHGERLRERARELGGILDADTTLRLDKPELRVEIDRARAADLGVDTAHIAAALRLMVGGDEKVSRFRDPAVNEDYDVALRLDEKDRHDPATLGHLYVPREGRGLVRLDNVVHIVPARTAARIDRSDRQREVRLRASIAPGFGLADRLAALRQAAVDLRLPAGYTTAISGRGREFERTFGEFLWVFALAVVFMYMILAAQFESVVHPLTILFSLPLSVPFALLSLWATGNTLNLYSALGILVLFGVVKKNSILQIDHMNALRAQGLDRMEAVMTGNRNRLRPILMTTLTLAAGMLPLAVGTGPGAEERRAIAVVVIGGQMLSLLLTLIGTPVLYAVLDDVARAHTRAAAAAARFGRRGRARASGLPTPPADAPRLHPPAAPASPSPGTAGPASPSASS